MKFKFAVLILILVLLIQHSLSFAAPIRRGPRVPRVPRGGAQTRLSMTPLWQSQASIVGVNALGYLLSLTTSSHYHVDLLGTAGKSKIKRKGRGGGVMRDARYGEAVMCLGCMKRYLCAWITRVIDVGHFTLFSLTLPAHHQPLPSVPFPAYTPAPLHASDCLPCASFYGVFAWDPFFSIACSRRDMTVA